MARRRVNDELMAAFMEYRSTVIHHRWLLKALLLRDNPVLMRMEIERSLEEHQTWGLRG